MPEPVFEWYKDKAGKFRFRLKASNGEIIAVGEAYNSKVGCLNGIESVKKNAPIAKIVADIGEMRYLMSMTEATKIILEPMKPVYLEDDIIALKNENGMITLYEVVR
jgi:uncharacterized protein YegP (UPF0339 family)